nr:hypothetical protein [Streptacidiphilus jeojiense]
MPSPKSMRVSVICQASVEPVVSAVTASGVAGVRVSVNFGVNGVGAVTVGLA